MQEVIKENVKLTNRMTQMMLLKELVRRRVPTKDVISIQRGTRGGMVEDRRTSR